MISTHITNLIKQNNPLLENIDDYQFTESVYSTDHDVATNPPTLIYINGKATYRDDIGPRIRVYEKYISAHKKLPPPHQMQYVAFDGDTSGQISQSVLSKVLEYIKINRVPLLQYWNSNGNMCVGMFRQQIKFV